MRDKPDLIQLISVFGGQPDYVWTSKDSFSRATLKILNTPRDNS